MKPLLKTAMVLSLHLVGSGSGLSDFNTTRSFATAKNSGGNIKPAAISYQFFASSCFDRSIGEDKLMIYYPISKGYRVSSRYGRRGRPTSGASRFHKGIDLACRCGTRVYAIARGRVIANSYSRGYGNYIVIDHGNEWRTLYAHLKKSMVRRNEIINGGESIGRVGQTGVATGCHLHFELIKRWKRLDPERILEF